MDSGDFDQRDLKCFSELNSKAIEGMPVRCPFCLSGNWRRLVVGGQEGFTPKGKKSGPGAHLLRIPDGSLQVTVSYDGA